MVSLCKVTSRKSGLVRWFAKEYSADGTTKMVPLTILQAMQLKMLLDTPQKNDHKGEYGR
jgi:hypothetical protein